MKKGPYKTREELEYFTAWGRRNAIPRTKEGRRADRLARKKRGKKQ